VARGGKFKKDGNYGTQQGDGRSGHVWVLLLKGPPPPGNLSWGNKKKKQAGTCAAVFHPLLFFWNLASTGGRGGWCGGAVA